MDHGLSSLQAKKRLIEVGKNEIITKKSFNALFSFLLQFPTLINGILFAGGIFSILIGNFIDASFIISIILLSAIFGFIQEYNAEKSLEKLKNYIKPLSRVIRNDKEEEIPSSEIVPGDIVLLNEGEYIPADGKIIVSHHLEIDESVLTGESIPVTKNDKDQGLCGTLVSRGKGRLLVEKTGMDTRFGQIAKTLTSVRPDKTPLQKSLTSLGKIISAVAITIAALLIPIGLSQKRDLFDLVLLSISAAVAAIPEGLPAVITIALAIGTNRLAKKNAIVRKMSAIETLGAVQIILSDKTGTLTKNEMVVKEFFLNKDTHLNFLLKSCVIGNTASLVQKGEFSAKGGPVSGWEAIGDKTDASLLIWAKEKIKDLSILTDGGKVIDEFVFDPQTKLITTIWEENLPGDKKKKRYVFVRGAPEKILENSTLDNMQRQAAEKKFENYARRGYRVIGFGFKNHEDKISTERGYLEKDIEFLGFVGIYDPPRDEAILAIKNAKEAGIKTIMVTGDNPLTALTIAKEIGIIENDEDVLTGDDLDKMSDEQLEKIILNTSVFARTKPEDKLRLVNIYKKMGYVVGVTGDGVNDALALKKADVGISMGQTGTDVAREASDIVLSDDNYSTLIRAVLEGRTIYNNILKSITYLLSSNLSEISLILFAAILKMPDPLLPIQILWINLVTDGLPALALASDNRNNSVLAEKPRDPKKKILTKNRLLFILTVGFSISTILMFIFSGLLKNNNQAFSRTIIFNLLIISHLILVFFIRGKSILKFNRTLVLAVFLTLLLQFIITTTPFFQKIFQLTLK